jgi:hypothetical protein
MYRDKNLRKNTFKGINFELKITLAEMVTNGSEVIRTLGQGEK